MKLTCIKLLGVIVLMMIGGCGTTVKKMPLRQDAMALDTAETSVLIATISIENKNRPSQQPVLCCIYAEQGIKKYSFKSPLLIKEVEQGAKQYLVSFDLEPGLAKIDFARFYRNHPSVGLANADLPLVHEIMVPENSVIYLGNINAVIKKIENKQDIPAGYHEPIVIQATVGFANGTFVVDITDNFEQDMQAFYRHYPYLKGRDVTKMILPQWVHPSRRPPVVK